MKQLGETTPRRYTDAISVEDAERLMNADDREMPQNVRLVLGGIAAGMSDGTICSLVGDSKAAIEETKEYIENHDA